MGNAWKSQKRIWSMNTVYRQLSKIGSKSFLSSIWMFYNPTVYETSTKLLIYQRTQSLVKNLWNCNCSKIKKREIQKAIFTQCAFLEEYSKQGHWSVPMLLLSSYQMLPYFDTKEKSKYQFHKLKYRWTQFSFLPICKGEKSQFLYKVSWGNSKNLPGKQKTCNLQCLASAHKR